MYLVSSSENADISDKDVVKVSIPCFCMYHCVCVCVCVQDSGCHRNTCLQELAQKSQTLLATLNGYGTQGENGQITVTRLRWDDKLIKVSLLSTKDQTIRLEAAGTSQQVTLAAGKEVALEIKK